MNINPRSIYNKSKEFKEFIRINSVDIVCMSESWERENFPIESLINLNEYEVVSNVYQRKGKGGRPLILANKTKFTVQNLTNSLIDIPWGIEAVWATLTPKQITNSSIIKKIVVGSLYFPPNNKHKSLFLDHICETYNFLSSKYNDGLYWLLAGDTNELNLDSILRLDPNIKQMVEEPTRVGSDKILDPIITNLCKYYSIPECLQPLNPDCSCLGKPSDHKMIIMKPISVMNNRKTRRKRHLVLRPLPDSKLLNFEKWLKTFSWQKLYDLESSHDKAEYFQKVLYENVQIYLPEKVVKFCNEDQPFFTPELKSLDRQRKREFNKNRRSNKYINLNRKFKLKCRQAKSSFYKKFIEDLKISQPRQWYSKVKRLTKFNPHDNDIIQCEEIEQYDDIIKLS